MRDDLFHYRGFMSLSLSLSLSVPACVRERVRGSSRARSQTCDNAIFSIQIKDIMKHSCITYLFSMNVIMTDNSQTKERFSNGAYWLH